MIFASYHTPNGRYPELARRLKESLNAFDLRSRINVVADAGDWRKSLLLKPRYIRQCLLDHRCPVVWLDCDCEVRRLPSLLFGSHDFAAYNWHADPGNPVNIPADFSRLVCSGGVLMFGYTAAAMELLDRWEEEQHRDEAKGDDPALDYVFNHYHPPVNPLWLPRSYNFMGGKFGEPGSDCVIFHDYQRGGHRCD